MARRNNKKEPNKGVKVGRIDAVDEQEPATPIPQELLEEEQPVSSSEETSEFREIAVKREPEKDKEDKEEKKETIEDILSSLNIKQKIAVLLTVLGEDSAAKILERLDRKLAEVIVWEISKLRIIPKELGEAVIQEFWDFYEKTKGGRVYAAKLLRKAFGAVEADKILSKGTEKKIKPLEELLSERTSDEIADVLRNEHPQIIAIVLSMLPPNKSVDVLKTFPIDLQIDVVRRLAQSRGIASSAFNVAEKHLRERITGPTEVTITAEEKGAKIAAGILSRSDMDVRKQILEALRESDQDIADAIRREMFTFEDIIRLDNRTLQTIIMQIDIRDIALALKGADEALKNKFIRNMSERMAEALEEELESLGPTRWSQINEAQRKICDLILQLEEQGKVVLPGRGEVIVE